MKRYWTVLTLFLFAAMPAQADFPSTINYQGRLVSGTNLVNDVVDMTFRLYTSSTGGSAIFESTNSVLVVDGLYNTEIGENIALGDLHDALNQYPIYLEVEVNGDTLEPRERFAAVPFALKTAPPSQGQNVSILDDRGVETFYPSLTNAFDNLESGQTLRLYSGIHPLEVQPVPVGSATDPKGLAGLVLDNKHDIRIEGIGGPTISSAQYGDYLFIQNSYNIEIEGITFDGPGPSSGIATLFTMINFRHTNRNIRIANCRFTNFGNHGISHLGGDKLTTHVLIENCHFENGGMTGHPALGDDGAAISGIGSYWTIVNNHIINVLRGIEIEGPGPSSQSHIVIAKNTLRDIWSHGIMLFASSKVAENYSSISISDNVLSGLNPRKPEVNHGGWGIFIGGGEFISIRGNIVSDFPHAPGAIGFIPGTPMQHIAIQNNIIYSRRNVPQPHFRGIFLWQSNTNSMSHFRIDGNIVTGAELYGIYVNGFGHTVMNNSIIGNGSTPNDHGLLVATSIGDTDEIQVSGNFFQGNANGITVTTDVGPCVYFGDNFFRDNTHNDIADERATPGDCGRMVFGDLIVSGDLTASTVSADSIHPSDGVTITNAVAVWNGSDVDTNEWVFIDGVRVQ